MSGIKEKPLRLFRTFLEKMLSVCRVGRYRDSILIRYDIFFDLTNSNDSESWDERFKRPELVAEHLEQSHYFYNNASEMFPEEVKKLLREGATVADFGCALGSGTAILAELYPNSKWIGLEQSSAAINYAKQNYSQSNLEFRISETEIRNFPHFDIIFSSNTLEHFKKPWALMKEMGMVTDKYIIALVPFSAGLSSVHFYSFTDKNIKKSIGGFSLTDKKTRDLRHLTDTAWLGVQALLVYKKTHDTQ